MAAALTGLTGLAGYQVQVDADAQATPEQRSGGTVDEKHGKRGEDARPYSWQSQVVQSGGHGPYGPENQLLGDAEWVWQPGGDGSDDPAYDYTPTTHAAPFPKGNLSGPTPGVGPDDIAAQLRQSYAIHSTNMGASRRMTTSLADPQNDDWVEYTDNSAGHSDDVEPPDLFKSAGYGFGTTDRTQSFARQNGYDFDTAHKHRRWAAGTIPGNTNWMRPGGRLLMKSMPGPARPPIGPESPFSGQDLGRSFGVGGAVLLDTPTEYVAPPTPNLTVPVWHDTPSEAVVELW